MEGIGGLQEARDRLVGLGLEADMASTYIHLLAVGRGRPGAVALAMRISRSEAYRRLERLAEEGLAEATGQRPVLYHPADPTAVFDLLHQRHVRRAETVLEVAQEMAPILQEMDTWSGETAASTFRTLDGRPAVHQEIHRLLNDAADEVLVVNTHPGAGHMALRSGLWGRLQRRIQEGVRVRLVLSDAMPVDGMVEGPMDWLRFIGSKAGWRFMIVDDEEVLLSTATDRSTWLDSPLERALLTGAPGFLSSQRSLFHLLWDRGAPFRPRAPVEAAPWLEEQA